MAKTAVRNQVDITLRDEWLQTIADIKTQIQTWVLAEPGWNMAETGTNEILEGPLGQYTVTIWSICTPEGEIRLEPIARNYPGRSIVELYAWPTAYRVRLIQDADDGWRVLTDSGLYLHQPWDRDHFIMLVRELIGAEEMIAVG